MIDAIRQARMLARKMQEKLYDGRATVTESQKVKDEKTKLTSTEEVIVLEDEPCRLSYSNVSTTDQTESVAKTSQIIKLFMSPETKIKPGAKITVTQAGVTETYECSGNQFCIQYVPKSIPNSHAALWECNEVAESLTWCMEYIDVNGDLLRGTNMHHEIADGILNFFMNYNCFVCKEETHTVMDNITSEMEVKEGE